MQNILFLAGLFAVIIIKFKFVMISSNAFQGYCQVQLLVLKTFLKDFERFKLAQCSTVHLFSDCFATDLMNGKWGHNLVV